MGVWKRFSENRQSFTDHNFSVKCPFLIVLGLFENLDIDLSGSFEILKKYSLSSELELLKVEQISEISEISGNPLLLGDCVKETLEKVFRCLNCLKNNQTIFYTEISELNGRIH